MINNKLVYDKIYPVLFIYILIYIIIDVNIRNKLMTILETNDDENKLFIKKVYLK